MNTYSHLFLASQLEMHFRPRAPSDYYWGAIVPDIRYFTGMPRSHTHLSQDQLSKYLSIYPHLESFVQGYRVHCLLDEIDLNLVFSRRLVFYLIRNRVPRHFASVLLEYYYLASEKIQPAVAGSANEILGELGITEEALRPMQDFLASFLAAPSFNIEASALQGLGLIENGRIDGYLRASATLERQPLLRSLLFASLGFKGMSSQFTSYVLGRWRGKT